MEKQYKSSISKNHKITFFILFPLKAMQPFKLFLNFAPKKKKKKKKLCGNIMTLEFDNITNMYMKFFSLMSLSDANV